MPASADEEPDRARNALARELIADDADRQREDAAADALQHVPGRHDLERAPQREITLPAAKITSDRTNRRRLPNMSPSRPMIGVATAVIR